MQSESKKRKRVKERLGKISQPSKVSGGLGKSDVNTIRDPEDWGRFEHNLHDYLFCSFFFFFSLSFVIFPRCCTSWF